jgi:hypothetical protein
MRGADAAVTSAPPPEGPSVDRRKALLLVGGVLVLAVAWFLWFDAWWLNSDGSSYLSIGKSFVNGHGFKLPDGTTLAWWDRPAYPLLLTAPWFVRESFEASIWMSRIPLILAAPIVAAGTLRFTKSLTAAAIAGVAAIAQPWTLLAGGSNLVPDGLTALGIVAGVLSASAAVTAAKRARVWWLLGALFAVVLASATKETGLLGFVLVAIVLWVGFARPRRWVVLVGLAALVPVVVALLVVANGEPSTSYLDLPSELVDRMRQEAFAGSSLVIVVAVLALALCVWALPKCTDPLPLAGLVLIAPGLALGLYASGSGLGMRNAVLLPYGVCLLLGALVGDWARRGSVPLLKVVAIAGAALLIVGFAGGSDARAERASDTAARSWDSPATRAASGWLRANAGSRQAGCTLQFCSFYWLAADGKLNLELLPQYSARLGSKSTDDLDYEERAGFRGPEEATPECTGTPLVVTKSDERFGTIFECPLLEYVRRNQPQYVVVSGWGGTDTFDAGRLIPYMEANPAFKRVFATTPADWPRSIAIYEVVGDPQPLEGAVSYYSAAAYEALPGDRDKPGVTLLDGACYAETIQQILAQPPGAAAAEGATKPTSCAATLR